MIRKRILIKGVHETENVPILITPEVFRFLLLIERTFVGIKVCSLRWKVS